MKNIQIIVTYTEGHASATITPKNWDKIKKRLDRKKSLTIRVDEKDFFIPFHSIEHIESWEEV